MHIGCDDREQVARGEKDASYLNVTPERTYPFNFVKIMNISQYKKKLNLISTTNLEKYFGGA